MSTIKLNKRITQQTDNSYRLQVWVSETSDGIPSEIFLYTALNLASDDGWSGSTSRLQKVCSYADLINYASTSPDTSSSYFRRSWIDLKFRSLSELDDLWDNLNTYTEFLVNDIVRTTEAVASDISFTGDNFTVTASLKHYSADNYSYMLSMSSTKNVFVVEKQTDGEPELVSIAGLDDLDQFSDTERDSGFYLTDSAVLMFSSSSIYTQAKAAIWADFSSLDTELSDPGEDSEGTGNETLESSETTEETLYFGDNV